MGVPDAERSLKVSNGTAWGPELDKKITWNVGYWLIALVLLLMQDLWQNASQVQTVPYTRMVENTLLRDLAKDLRRVDSDLRRPMMGPVGVAP